MKTSHPGFVYHLFPLGSQGALRNNPGGLSPSGKLSQVEEWIPHWRALGVDTILFGPIFDSESHGYDTRDLRKIDPRLGSRDDLVKLMGSLKRAGFKILFDGVFNHTSRSFPAFLELLQSGGHGDKASWYKEIRPGNPGFHGATFSYRGWNGHGSLPELNLGSQDVRRYLLDSVGIWMDDFGIDGLRLDAADVLDFDFMRELSDFCREKRSDFWLVGEVIHGDYSRWIHQAGLNSVTNYELYKSLWSSLKDQNFFELTWTLNRQFGPQGLCKNFPPLTFLDNHDVSRLASLLDNPLDRDMAWELSFLLPGIPSVYYGSEWDWKALKGQGDDWNLRPYCHPGEQYGKPGRVTLLRNLADLRKGHPVLSTGSLEVLGNTNRQLVFQRSGQESVLVLVNVADSWTTWTGAGRSLKCQIWGPTTAQPHGHDGRFSLPPSSILVYTLG